MIVYVLSSVILSLSKNDAEASPLCFDRLNMTALYHLIVPLFALGIEADTGPWLRPVQYEWIARPAGNAQILIILYLLSHLSPLIL